MQQWQNPEFAPGEASMQQEDPQTYAQWSALLEQLARGDDDAHCLQQLRQGTLSWTGGVAPLFAQRMSDEVHRRLRVCADRLGRDLRLGSDETQVVRALLQARAQLGFIHQLCHLPALPADIRARLAAEVSTFAEKSQRSLMDSARGDRTGRLAFLVRNTPLLHYQRDGAGAPPAAAPIATSTRRRRQILL